MSTLEGALNPELTTPPEASPASETEPIPFFETQVIDDEDEFARLAAQVQDTPEPAPQTQDDAAGGNEGAEVVKAHEKAIPYERFDEVNRKNQEYEQRLRQMEEQSASLGRAFAAGYSTIEAYNAANAWAQANNFASIESYRAYQQEQAELQQYTDALDGRDDLSEAARNELLAARQQFLETQRAQRELNEQVQVLRVQTLEQTIQTARAELGGLDPELERIFRESNPQIVQRATAAFKRQQDGRIAALQAQLNQVQAQTATAIQNGKAEYAANKLRQQATPPPEGRGGQTPAPATAATPTNFKSRTFADLIFRQNAKG